MSARQLFALQDVDLKLGEARQEVASLEKEFQDQTAIARARRRVETLRERVHELRTAQRDKEMETSQLQRRARELEEQMYSGRVKNPRELEGIRADVDHLKGRISALESDTLELMEQADQEEQRLRQAEGALERTTTERGRRERDIQERLQDLRSRIETLEAERTALAGEVDAAALRLYDRIRQNRNGHAVARVEGGRCRACHISIPSGEFQRARAGRDLVQCGSCQRILYVA